MTVDIIMCKMVIVMHFCFTFLNQILNSGIQKNANEEVVVLQIERVYTQHFRTYVFEASNSLGRTTHEISLEEGEDMNKPGRKSWYV